MTKRLLVTFLLPIVVYVAGYAIPLPGLTAGASLFIPAMEDPINLGLFSLGVSPFVSAYIFVEVVAIAVPPLRRLRHGNPDGRRKLEIGVGVVAIVLATFQAYGVAAQLEVMASLANPFYSGPTVESKIVIVASLVGGTCLLLLVARTISRQGLANGFMLLVAVGLLIEYAGLRRSLVKGLQLGTFMPIHALVFVTALASAVYATVRVLRPPEGSATPSRSSTGVYRDARAFAIEPWVPVPSSSFAPYTAAASLLLLPRALQALLSRSGAPPPFSDWPDAYFLALRAVLVLVLVVILTRFLQRPAEIAELAERLGLRGAEVAEGVRRARMQALRPTLVYFVVLLVADAALAKVPELRFGLLGVPMLVAIVLDVARAVRETREPDLVSVWQERRASAVPILQAALGAEGIPSRATGMAVLSLFQAFAPYAPADILVHAADAPRATALLRHLLLGEAAPEREAAAAVPSAGTATKPPRLWPVLVPAVLALVVAFAPKPRPHDGPVRRAELQVLAVADDYELWVAEEALPPGVETRIENAPLGLESGQSVTRRRLFLQVEARQGEALEEAIVRADAFLRANVSLPPGHRVLWSIDEGYSDDGEAPVRSARTFVVFGEPILATEDVVDAMPSIEESSGVPRVYVGITLAPSAATRFEQATAVNVNRRIAIVVDGRISAAPVVRSKIGGGRLSIMMGEGDPAKQLAEAKALAAGLAPAR